MTDSRKNQQWPISAAVLAAVVIAVVLILAPALSRGGLPLCRAAQCTPATSQTRPLLLIDHHASSAACRQFLEAYKRSPELRQWLHSRYRIQWRNALPAADLPRFWRGSQLVARGWQGVQPLRESLSRPAETSGDQQSEAGQQPAAQQQIQDLQTSLASVDSRFQQADQDFSEQLKALGNRLDPTFAGIDERLNAAHRQITGITDANLSLVRKQRSLDESQQHHGKALAAIRRQVRERIKQAASPAATDIVAGAGVSLLQLLTIAGVIGGGGLGGGVGGWLLLKGIRFLGRKLLRRRSKGEASTGHPAEQPTPSTQCADQLQRIDRVNQQIANLSRQRAQETAETDRGTETSLARISELQRLVADLKQELATATENPPGDFVVKVDGTLSSLSWEWAYKAALIKFEGHAEKTDAVRQLKALRDQHFSGEVARETAPV